VGRENVFGAVHFFGADALLAKRAGSSMKSIFREISRSLGPGGVSLALVSCVGTTGGDSFGFDAYAQGAPGAAESSYSFSPPAHGYDVTLTRATLHVGAVYLNRSVATSVSSNTVCTLPGVYGAQALAGPGGFVVNLLSAELQPFPARGEATSDPDFTGEVWLNGGDVNQPDDATVILDVAGAARKAGVEYPFAGVLTIGANRADAGTVASPGLHPICKERIVAPIELRITPVRAGSLVLAVDPAPMFANVDFAELARGADGLFHFDDAAETATHTVDNASKSLYAGLHATTAYRIVWKNP
jgi:hypothetical protein